MKNRHKALSFVIVVQMIVAMSVFSQADLPKNTSATSFSLPKTTNGEKDMLIVGKSAKSFGSFISITGAHISLYPMKTRDSRTEVFSPNVSYNLSQEKATGNKRVNIRIYPRKKDTEPKTKRKVFNTVIDGIGFDLDNKAQTLRIWSDVSVKIFPLSTEQPLQVTTITSKTLFHDVLKHKIIFTGNVKVVSDDKEQATNYTLDCDKLTVFTDKDGKPTTMTADGKVILTQGNDVATSDNAVYRLMIAGKPGTWPNLGTTIEHPQFDRFILSGNPIIKTTNQKLKDADKVIIDQCGDKRNVQTVGGRPEMHLEKSKKSPSLIPAFSGSRVPPEGDLK